MLIRPTSLLLQEGHGIITPLRGHQTDLTCAAQMVYREKHLVPREAGAATHHLFEGAHRNSSHQIDHLIFWVDLLCHVVTF